MIRKQSPEKWCPRWDNHDVYDNHEYYADRAIILILKIMMTGDIDNHQQNVVHGEVIMIIMMITINVPL